MYIQGSGQIGLEEAAFQQSGIDISDLANGLLSKSIASCVMVAMYLTCTELGTVVSFFQLQNQPGRLLSTEDFCKDRCRWKPSYPSKLFSK